jgi:FkbM family methyltransferase
VVYSGGVGGDVSFEHDLVKNYGCQVVLFDPSPTGIKTMALPENKIPQFRFYPVALAAHNGTLKFAAPSSGQCWFAQNDGEGLEVACTNLESAMKQNGHSHIDLLKLDIEGSEYEVVNDLLKNRLPVREICVEYHHGIVPGISRTRSIWSILRLKSRGYRLIDQTGNNHTFVRPV